MCVGGICAEAAHALGTEVAVARSARQIARVARVDLSVIVRWAQENEVSLSVGREATLGEPLLEEHDAILDAIANEPRWRAALQIAELRIAQLLPTRH